MLTAPISKRKNQNCPCFGYQVACQHLDILKYFQSAHHNNAAEILLGVSSTQQQSTTSNYNSVQCEWLHYLYL